MSNSQPFTSTPPQGTVPAFKAYTVAYRRTETPFVSPQVSPEDAALALGQRVGDEACRYASDAGPIDDYVVSSTVLSQFLADGSPHAGIFQEAIATRYGRRPDWAEGNSSSQHPGDRRRGSMSRGLIPPSNMPLYLSTWPFP